MRSVLCLVAVAALGLSAPTAQAASLPNVPKMFSNAWTKVSDTVKRPFVKKASVTALAPAEQVAIATDTLVLYSNAGWRGRELKLATDTPNLADLNFNNRTRSMRIPAGESWEFCSQRAYQGTCRIFTGEVRDLKHQEMAEQITSARKLANAAEAPAATETPKT